jgi:uncharacterized protein DUF3299
MRTPYPVLRIIYSALPSPHSTRAAFGGRLCTRLWWLLGLVLCSGYGCERPVTGADPATAKTAGISSAQRAATAAADPRIAESGRKDQGESEKPGPVAMAAPSSGLSSRSQIIDSTFDDIKFEMEKTEPFVKSMLTSRVEQLFDQRIRIRGYIYPTLRKRGLRQFVLVRDNLECCFGPGAALFDCILVQMVEGKTAEYTIRPVAVEGTFRFEEFLGPDGKHMAIFRLDGEKVE